MIEILISGIKKFFWKHRSRLETLQANEIESDYTRGAQMKNYANFKCPIILFIAYVNKKRLNSSN